MVMYHNEFETKGSKWGMGDFNARSGSIFVSLCKKHSGRQGELLVIAIGAKV